ncbi:hypothetical protein KSF_078240 [Reticulibacter mediterranei]|uniref:Uncharacterized protein n=1 Tax=Reticulibacter mediterranei TaxID=2778369 RepID=A0A8J3IYX0_9CHLR|nr:hypothetical protein [Reticulibacter mediterranei]GHO97776.1 hypothetical protein KSF_078240 [Reticulibacter mediterranei]
MPEGYYYHHGGSSHHRGSGEGSDRRGGGDRKQSSKLDLFRPEKREKRELEEIRARQEGLHTWFQGRFTDLETKYNSEVKKIDNFTSRISERVVERTEIALDQKARLGALYGELYQTLDTDSSAFANDMAQFGQWAENTTRFEYFTGLNTRPLRKSIEDWEKKKATMLSSQTTRWNEITDALRDERRPERVEAINISIGKLRTDLTNLKGWGDHYAGIEHGKIDDWIRSGSGRAAAARELRGLVRELQDDYDQTSRFESKSTKLREKDYTNEEWRKQIDLKAFEDFIDYWRTTADGLAGSRDAQWRNLGADLGRGRQEFEQQQRAAAEAEQRRQYQAQYGGYQNYEYYDDTNY